MYIFFSSLNHRYDIIICVYWFELFSQVSDVAHGPLVSHLDRPITDGISLLPFLLFLPLWVSSLGDKPTRDPGVLFATHCLWGIYVTFPSGILIYLPCHVSARDRTAYLAMGPVIALVNWKTGILWMSLTIYSYILCPLRLLMMNWWPWNIIKATG